MRPRRGETRRTGGDRTDVTGPPSGERTERAGREKESERAKRKAGVHNGSEKQSETYELILIGGDSGEYGLREYEGLVRLLLEVHDRLRRARVRPLHQVDPRLVLVHRVQDQLQIIRNCIGGVQRKRWDTLANKRASPVNDFPNRRFLPSFHPFARVHHSSIGRELYNGYSYDLKRS